MAPLNNERLVIDPGNQWPKKGSVAPFFGIPAWWRRFMFHQSVLSPRAVTVYFYLCSVMDLNSVAYPAYDQIAGDIGLESRSIVIKAIDDLVDRGFILKSAQPHVGRIIGKRTVFQRPAPEFTLLRLFELKLIDSDLHPLATAADRQQSQKRETLARASDDVVKAGLRRLVGDEMFQVYSQMRTEERRLRALVDTLNSSLEASRSAELDKRTAERIKKLFRPKDLTAELEQLILEEEAEQEAEREPVPF